MSHAPTRDVPATRAMPRLPVALVLIALLGLGCGAGAPSGSASAAAPASSAATTPASPGPGSLASGSASPGSAIPRDLCANLGSDCALAAGDYLAQLFQPAAHFKLGDGWLNNAYSPHAVQILHGETAGISLISGELAGGAGQLGTSPSQLASYLAGRPGLTAGAPRSVSLGGASGLALDVRVGKGAVALFDQPLGPGQKDTFTLAPTESARFLVLDVRGERVLVIVEAIPPTDLATFLREDAQAVLDSLAFPQPGSSG